MQTPTGRQLPTHPIPQPRPHGPADLGILAEDLDYLAQMHGRSQEPELETGMYGQAQVSGSRLDPHAGYAPGGYVDGGYVERGYVGGGYAEGGQVGLGHGGLGHAGLEGGDLGHASLEHGSLEYGDLGHGDLGHGDLGSADAGFPADAEFPAEPVPAGPIFVDASGRRRKLARRASLAAIAVVAGYAGLLGVSFIGGPIPPNTLLPVPGMPSEKAPAPASTSVAENGASTSGKPGGAEHPAAARPTGSASEHRPDTHASTTAGKNPTEASSAPQPTSTSSASVVPPLPTPTMPPSSTSLSTATTTHGNPTPPGHQRKSSPGPTT